MFEAWLDPNMLARFMLPGESMSVPNAESDATVGDRFAIIMQVGDQQIPHSGSYLTIDRFSQIIFT